MVCVQHRQVGLGLTQLLTDRQHKLFDSVSAGRPGADTAPDRQHKLFDSVSAGRPGADTAPDRQTTQAV